MSLIPDGYFREMVKFYRRGSLILDIEPGKKAVVKVPFTKPEIKEGTEYFLLLSFHQKEKTLWAETGFEIAWDQMELPWFKPAVFLHLLNLILFGCR